MAYKCFPNILLNHIINKIKATPTPRSDVNDRSPGNLPRLANILLKSKEG